MVRRRTASPEGQTAKRVVSAELVPPPPKKRRISVGGSSESGADTSRYEKRRQAILDAAAHLFNEKGVKGATLADVAERLGLGATAISYYYPTKEHLAAACFLKAIAAFDDIFVRAAQGFNAATRLSLAVSLYFEAVKEIAMNQRPPLVAFDDILALKPPHADAVFGAYTSMFRRVRTLFNGETGLERVEQNARSHLFLSLLLWVPGWIHRYEPEDYGRAAARVIDVLQHGLAGAEVERVTAPEILPVDLTIEARRDSFLRAATELVNERGYHGASIDKISARLNVTKGAFYHHNDRKDDVVVACFERTFDVVRRAQNAANEINGDSWTKLCSAVWALVHFQLSEQGPLLRTSALHSVARAVRYEMVARMNRLSNRFAAFIIDGAVDGSIRPVDPIVAGELVSAMINAAAELARWFPGITAETAPLLYARPLLTGILSRDM
jgi:AcrR family transcriptional regulator